MFLQFELSCLNLRKIKEINDTEILEEIYSWLDDESQQEIYITNDAQKLEVKEAQEQIKRGEGISEEKANDDIDEWLKSAK